MICGLVLPHNFRALTSTVLQSLDQEILFFELCTFHLVAHPNRGCASACPGQLGVLLAAVFGSDLAALQPAAPAAPASVRADLATAQPGELPLELVGLASES